MSEDLRAFAAGGGQAINRRAEMSRSQNSSDKAFSNRQSGRQLDRS